jgi:hypothetical protein
MNSAPLNPTESKRLLEMGMVTPFPTAQPTKKPKHKTMDQMSDGRYRYDVYVEEDVHWALVALGARSKMHQEDYVEQILMEYACIAMKRDPLFQDATEDSTDDNMGEQAQS